MLQDTHWPKLYHGIIRRRSLGSESTRLHEEKVNHKIESLGAAVKSYLEFGICPSTYLVAVI
jgi:hypothetical protein